MAISAGLARRLGGSIDVESEPGRGSRFVVRIEAPPAPGARWVDASQSAPERRRDEPQPRSQQTLEGLRILLVEDGRDNQKLIGFLLRRSGAEVEVVENGQLAVERLVGDEEREPVDVVLMDMQMPVLDGYSATRQLRALGYRRPILALTAHALAEDEQRCLEAGCDAFLTKPVDRGVLLEACARFGRGQDEQAA